MSEISEKAKELLESTVKNAIAYGQEKGNPFGLVSTYEAMFRLDKSDLEHYIATLEAENRALRHALELRECEEAEHKPDPLDSVPFVSLSNEEIAAMTPDHPLYKLVHGEGGEG